MASASRSALTSSGTANARRSRTAPRAICASRTSRASPAITGTHRMPSSRVSPRRSASTPKRRNGPAARTTTSISAVVGVVRVTSAAAATRVAIIPTTATARCQSPSHQFITAVNASNHHIGRSCLASTPGPRPATR